jgi:hypothetical protein
MLTIYNITKCSLHSLPPCMVKRVKFWRPQGTWHVAGMENVQRALVAKPLVNVHFEDLRIFVKDHAPSPATLLLPWFSRCHVNNAFPLFSPFFFWVNKPRLTIQSCLLPSPTSPQCFSTFTAGHKPMKSFAQCQ